VLVDLRQEPTTGARVEVELFVPVMGASNYTYGDAAIGRLDREPRPADRNGHQGDLEEARRELANKWRDRRLRQDRPGRREELFDVLYRPHKERERVDDDHTDRAA
jgi:hypothetical protein